MPTLRRLRLLPVLAFRRAMAPLGAVFIAAGSRNSKIARAYYGLVRRDFTREQASFLAGRRAYAESLLAPSGTMAVVRRNVHRIEKGLLMQPRRIPFALEYIGETVSAYFTMQTHTGARVDPMECRWATDVLTEYFEVNRDVPELAKYVAKFREAKLRSPTAQDEAPLIPYRRKSFEHPPVTFDALSVLSKQRRSVRWFLRKPVDRSLIDRALEVGAQAPSACNRQPFEFRIFDDPDLVKEVVKIPMGLAGYEHNVPVIAVVVGQQRHFFDERDRHLIYIDASLAVMGFVYALETLGLSSCCINWPDIDEKERKMAKLLHLETDERPIMLVALGHPDPNGLVAASAKKSLRQLRRYNHEQRDES